MARAKKKEKLSLDALLRVRKVTLEDFVKSQDGETIEEKIEAVKGRFDVLPEHELSLASLTKEENIAIKQVEDSKKVRKKKVVDEVEVQPEENIVSTEEKVEQDT